MKTFLGYPRPDGTFGIRNWVLVLPAQREVSLVASQISKLVNGAKVILTLGEGGRTKKDRETMARTLVGLAINPNVAAVLIVSLKRGSGYPEFRENVLEEQIAVSGKPVRTIVVHDLDGVYNSIGEGVRIARELVAQASEVRRVPAELKHLTIGVKCGMSDPTSGISGNPVVGRAFDMLIDAGGTAFFSETTEIIGAEKEVAKRAVTPEVGQAILKAVYDLEDKAIATGEDIRAINPIPANIAAGITTLEEKSIGAIAKSGTRPIQGMLQYAERPKKPGLYFVDAWMSSLSLPLSHAAAGAHIAVYQMGGGDLPKLYPTMPAYSSPTVSPLMYVTGNKQTYQKAIDSMDFDSSAIMEGKASIDEMGEKMLDRFLAIASGTLTKMETWNYTDPTEILLEGPNL